MSKSKPLTSAKNVPAPKSTPKLCGAINNSSPFKPEPCTLPLGHESRWHHSKNSSWRDDYDATPEPVPAPVDVAEPEQCAALLRGFEGWLRAILPHRATQTQELIFYFGHCIDTLESVVGSMHGVERARVEVLIGTYRNVIMLAQAGGQ
jgi:hypothetical protein